jgi:hypothetical protein
MRSFGVRPSLHQAATVAKRTIPMLPSQESKNSPLSALIGRLQQAIRTRREREELARLDGVEIEALAHDVGVSIEELFQLVERGPQSADLLPQLMRKLGLDPKAVERAEPVVMRDLQRACGLCDNHDRCDHDLDVGVILPAYHDYCPNAQTLDALMADAARQAREVEH